LKKITPEPILLALLYTCTTPHYTKEFELLLGQLFTSSPSMHKSEKQYIPCFSNFLPLPPFAEGFAHGETRCQNQRSPAKPCCSQLKYERQTLTLILALPGLIPFSHDNFHSLGMAINTTVRSLVWDLGMSIFKYRGRAAP